MEISIPQEVLQKTTQCPHDFSCLSTGQCGGREKCKVRDTNAKTALVLVSKEDRECPYRVSFADIQICRCPTHLAIYQRST